MEGVAHRCAFLLFGVSMPTQLLAVVTTVTLDSGDSIEWQHGLRANDKPVTPTQVIAGGPSTIGVTAVDDTTITLENLGPETATATFRAEYDHSIHAVDTASVVWTGWNGTARPVGPAGGDLDGTYPDPTVIGIQGYGIEDGAPVNGDTILFNSTLNQWQHAPITFSGGPPTGPASRDLGGNYPDPLVVGLQNAPLAATVANGFIKRNAANTGWEEVAYGSAANTVTQGNDARLSDARTPTGVAGGDLDGTYPNPTVDGLRGRPIDTAAPSAGDVYSWDGAKWTPVDINTLILEVTLISGSFSDSTTQNLPVKPTTLAVKYNTVEIAGGVTVANNGLGQPTRITVPTDGIYSFDISPQLLNTGGGGSTITFWAAIDGTPVPRSASSLEMGNNNNRTLPFLSLDLPMNAGQYLEWFFTATGSNTSLQFFPVDGVIPAIPSVIANVKRIGSIP